MNIPKHIASIRATLPTGVTLVCVSKFHSIEAIMEAYACGERNFGESRVQELLTKHESLPKDIIDRYYPNGDMHRMYVCEIKQFLVKE